MNELEITILQVLDNMIIFGCRNTTNNAIRIVQFSIVTTLDVSNLIEYDNERIVPNTTFEIPIPIRNLPITFGFVEVVTNRGIIHQSIEINFGDFEVIENDDL